jgi:hypothetical protein
MPADPARFFPDRKRTDGLPTAFAYCATCNKYEPVNDKLTGYRFDCPLWRLDAIHVAAVFGTRWKHLTWVRSMAKLEFYQGRRRPWKIIWILLFATVVSILLLSSPYHRVAKFVSAPVGAFLILDTILFTSANVLSSQRPRFPPRSIVRAILGLIQLVFGFALLYAGTGFNFMVSGKSTCLDLKQSLYFSIVTMATLGYGDITPSLNSSVMLLALVALEILCGLFYLSVFVATTVSWTRGIQRPMTLSELLKESDGLDKEDLKWRS